jgi:hypothetical protein
MAKKNYQVAQRLSHDGVDCLPGDLVEMEETRAESLLDAGVLVVPPKAKKTGGTKTGAAAQAASDGQQDELGGTGGDDAGAGEGDKE